MSSPIEARAAVLREVRGRFQIESVRVAAPRAREVRVRLVATGVCHTDLVARDGFPVPLPIVLGHEGAGIVESVGGEVTTLRPGDAVVLSFASCGGCANCALARPAYCHAFMAHNFAGVRPGDGSSALTQGDARVHGHFFGQSSFATIAIANERNAVKVDARAPLELLGPLGCGIQTGAGAVANSLKLRPGDSLAIFGGGAVGLSALLAARALDAGRVIVIEPNAGRGALAKELGATHVLSPHDTPDALAAIRELAGGGVTHALDTTGIPAVMAIAAETMLPNGMLGLIAVPPPGATLALDLTSFLVRGAGVKYIVEGDSDPREFIPRMLHWHAAGRFPFERLIRRFPFEQINEAAHASERGDAIKPVIVF
jgi:aryl-alcohol dehydrogenase/geraniol dehydrogenase (NAD+)